MTMTSHQHKSNLNKAANRNQILVVSTFEFVKTTSRIIQSNEAVSFIEMKHFPIFD